MQDEEMRMKKCRQKNADEEMRDEEMQDEDLSWNHQEGVPTGCRVSEHCFETMRIYTSHELQIKAQNSWMISGITASYR